MSFENCPIGHNPPKEVHFTVQVLNWETVRRSSLLLCLVGIVACGGSTTSPASRALDAGTVPLTFTGCYNCPFLTTPGTLLGFQAGYSGTATVTNSTEQGADVALPGFGLQHSGHVEAGGSVVHIYPPDNGRDALPEAARRRFELDATTV